MEPSLAHVVGSMVFTSLKNMVEKGFPAIRRNTLRDTHITKTERLQHDRPLREGRRITHQRSHLKLNRNQFRIQRILVQKEMSLFIHNWNKHHNSSATSTPKLISFFQSPKYIRRMRSNRRIFQYIIYCCATVDMYLIG